MEILHIAAECYPVAKAGGLGDVVGALPKYQVKLGHEAKVVIPMYRTRFLYENNWELVHEGNQRLGRICVGGGKEEREDDRDSKYRQDADARDRTVRSAYQSGHVAAHGSDDDTGNQYVNDAQGEGGAGV